MTGIRVDDRKEQRVWSPPRARVLARKLRINYQRSIFNRLNPIDNFQLSKPNSQHRNSATPAPRSAPPRRGLAFGGEIAPTSGRRWQKATNPGHRTGHIAPASAHRTPRQRRPTPDVATNSDNCQMPKVHIQNPIQRPEPLIRESARLRTGNRQTPTPNKQISTTNPHLATIDTQDPTSNLH